MDMMLIRVKVFPKSKEEKIIKKAKDKFEIKVREEAKRGEATKKVIKIISSYFPGSEVRMIKGSRERSKIFEIK